MKTLRAILVALLVLDVVALLGLVVLAIAAHFGPLAEDPHGYTVIFAIFLGAPLVPVGLFLLLVLKWTRPRP